MAVPDHSPKGAGANPRTPARDFFRFRLSCLCSLFGAHELLPRAPLAVVDSVGLRSVEHCREMICVDSMALNSSSFLPRPPHPIPVRPRALARTIATKNREKKIRTHQRRMVLGILETDGPRTHRGTPGLAWPRQTPQKVFRELSNRLHEQVESTAVLREPFEPPCVEVAMICAVEIVCTATAPAPPVPWRPRRR